MLQSLKSDLCMHSLHLDLSGFLHRVKVSASQMIAFAAMGFPILLSNLPEQRKKQKKPSLTSQNLWKRLKARVASEPWFSSASPLSAKLSALSSRLSFIKQHEQYHWHQGYGRAPDAAKKMGPSYGAEICQPSVPGSLQTSTTHLFYFRSWTALNSPFVCSVSSY